MRKPHNLITAFWDDMLFFMSEAEKSQKKKIENNLPILYPSDKRGFRFTILSAFLFLEAFINAEYFDHLYTGGPAPLSESQKVDLDNLFKKTTFEYKWSKWLNMFSGNDTPDFKYENQFLEIRKLKEWRNQLTHYKLHHLFLIAKEIETIENARSAYRIAVESIYWYYQITGFDPNEWIKNDVLNLIALK